MSLAMVMAVTESWIVMMRKQTTNNNHDDVVTQADFPTISVLAFASASSRRKHDLAHEKSYC